MKNTTSILKHKPKEEFQTGQVPRLGIIKVAGTQLLLDPKTELLELLKFTLFDLTLKQVLIIKKVIKKAHPRDRHAREYILVKTGKNFIKYKPSPFEAYFTERMTPNSYFQLRIYLKAIYKEIPSEYKYKKEIIQNLGITDLFKGDWLSYIFPWVRRTPKGDALKTEITNYLNEVDKNIRNLIDKEPTKALELLQFLQGNIFLLKNLKLDLIEKLKGIKIVPNSSNEDASEEYWYWWDLDIFVSDMFDIFDSVSDYFDTNIIGDWISDFDGDIGVDFGDSFDF